MRHRRAFEGRPQRGKDVALIPVLAQKCGTPRKPQFPRAVPIPFESHDINLPHVRWALPPNRPQWWFDLLIGSPPAQRNVECGMRDTPAFVPRIYASSFRPRIFRTTQ
jgi:hypothetical protein